MFLRSKMPACLDMAWSRNVQFWFSKFLIEVNNCQFSVKLELFMSVTVLIWHGMALVNKVQGCLFYLHVLVELSWVLEPWRLIRHGSLHRLQCNVIRTSLVVSEKLYPSRFECIIRRIFLTGKIAWKQAVQGVREMCDICDATLFNVHWVCRKCGFAVCTDCFRTRSHKASNGTDAKSATCENHGRKWLTCSANRQLHEPENLMMVQIIPSDG